MPKPVTIAEVAARAGVHPATVSRALSPATEHRINPATVRRVKESARELGYVTNVMARSLRTKTSMTIGVILPDLTNPIFPPIVRGAESVLGPKGYTTLIANTDGHDEVERHSFESLLQRRADGFIVATGHSEHPLLQEAFKRGVNVVTVNRGSPEAPFPGVTADNAGGMRALVEHLLALGHRTLLHLAGPHGFITAASRAEGFLAATASQRGVTASIVELSALSIDAGLRATTEAIKLARRPDAIVAGNDLVAVGALRAIRAAGLRCPDDISVTGFNDINFAADFAPSLTTVRIPHFEMGAHAAKLLLEALSSPRTMAPGEEPATVVLPSKLIIRDSTGMRR